MAKKVGLSSVAERWWLRCGVELLCYTREEYERKKGVKVDEVFPQEHYFAMHRIPFRRGIIHVENIGGDIAQVTNRRCKIGCFPWRFEGGEAAMCRVVAFLEE